MIYEHTLPKMHLKWHWIANLYHNLLISFKLYSVTFKVHSVIYKLVYILNNRKMKDTQEETKKVYLELSLCE